MKHRDESVEDHLKHCEECAKVADLPYSPAMQAGINMTIKQAHQALEFYEEGLARLGFPDHDSAPEIVQNSAMVGCIGRALNMTDAVFEEHLEHPEALAYLATSLIEAYERLVMIARMNQAELS